jgi:hypothetical protein
MSELKDYASSLLDFKVNEPKAKQTTEFKTFVNFAKLENNNIYEENISFKEMIYRVAYSHSGKCLCGEKLTFRTLKEGFPLTCSFACRSKHPQFLENLRKAKSAQYNDPIKKAEIEAKKIATNMKNLGVAHPMQNLTSLEKQVKSCVKGHKLHRGLLMQGYEPEAYDFVAGLYGEENVVKGIDYMRQNNISINWTDEEGKPRRSYPDFFILSMNAFLEIKSSYTIVTGKYKVKKCQERLNELQFGYILMQVDKTKSGNNFMYQIYNHSYIIDADPSE